MQTRGICILVQFCPILTFCNRLLPLFASASSSIRDSSLLLTFVLQYSIFSTEFKAFLIFSCSAALSLCFPLRCESSLNQATLASSSQSPLPPFGAQGTSLLNVCASSHLFANLTPTFFAPGASTRMKPHLHWIPAPRIGVCHPMRPSYVSACPFAAGSIRSSLSKKCIGVAFVVQQHSRLYRRLNRSGHPWMIYCEPFSSCRPSVPAI